MISLENFALLNQNAILMSDTLPQPPEQKHASWPPPRQTSCGSTHMQDASALASFSAFLHIGEIIIGWWDKGVKTDRGKGALKAWLHTIWCNYALVWRFLWICGSFVNIKHTSVHLQKLVWTQISFNEFLMFTRIQNPIYPQCPHRKSAPRKSSKQQQDPFHRRQER